MSSSTDYTADKIQVLEGIEPVRRRPGMFIGSTDAKGLHHLLTEIIDNSIDEALSGNAQNIWVYLQKDGQARVIDDGRGIPVEKHPALGVSALEVAMTRLHAGAKFQKGTYKVSGGLHGVGASAVNALSQKMRVEVRRNGKLYYQEYRRGKPLAPVKEIPLPKDDLPQTGTQTIFLPDPQIFEDTNFSRAKVEQSLRLRAYLIPKIFIHFFDEREGYQKHFYFEGGIRSLLKRANRDHKKISPIVYISKKDEKLNLEAEVAFQYIDDIEENIQSFVNVIPTPDEGTHVAGFRSGLTRVINDYALGKNLVKEGEKFSGEDTKEGLTAIIYIKMPSEKIQFESQTKTKLNNKEVGLFVNQIVREELATFLEEHPAEGRGIVEKIKIGLQARLAAKAARQAVLRKSALGSGSLPGKLADCQVKNPELAELFIVEGDSAGGCFSLNTKVALTDNREVDFKTLREEEKKGKKNYCYTIKKDGSLGIGLIKNVRKTKENARVIKIILDNNQKIICTPDHPFMLKDGRYKKASELTPKDSLMPLYRKYSQKEGRITIEGYEMVLDPQKNNQWIFTHLLADKYNLDHHFYQNKKGFHKHHVDFNKLNNNPDNIRQISKEEHLACHRQLLEFTIHRQDVKEKTKALHQTPEFREKIKKIMTTPRMKTMLSSRAKKQWENDEYKDYMANQFQTFYQNSPQYRKENKARLDKIQKEYWRQEENRKAQSKRVKIYFKNHPEKAKELSLTAKKQWQDPKLQLWRRQKTKEQWTDEFREKRKIAYNKTYYQQTLSFLRSIYEKDGHLENYDQQRLLSNNKNLLKLTTFCQRFFGGNQKAAEEAVQKYNHKIKKIVPLKKRRDVYDLEVEGTHNFALAAGVFVHNSAKQGRDRRFQAIFPLRGKLLNTEQARLDKIIKFEELKNLVTVLGMGIGESQSPEKLRYQKVIIMTDADVDGEHIATLLLTFFYRHLPHIVENGYLYLAQPPLYKISTGGKDHYVYSDSEKEALLKSLDSQKVRIQRYKGLGEMNPEQLWQTTMDPKTRILKKITIEDIQEADHTFDMLLGKEVLPRRRFIQANAKLAELDI